MIVDGILTIYPFFFLMVSRLRETTYLSVFDMNQFDNPIVNMSGELFINSKPFIIADSLQCIDWSIVDAIFVSSIDSYLLLPIILRDTSFCGAIYVPSSLDFVYYSFYFLSIDWKRDLFIPCIRFCFYRKVIPFDLSLAMFTCFSGF